MRGSTVIVTAVDNGNSARLFTGLICKLGDTNNSHDCRSQDADIILEHPSSSRQHAIIKFQADSNQRTLIDSGSAHGTFVNTKQLTKV